VLREGKMSIQYNTLKSWSGVSNQLDSSDEELWMPPSFLAPGGKQHDFTFAVLDE